MLKTRSHRGVEAAPRRALLPLLLFACLLFVAGPAVPAAGQMERTADFRQIVRGAKAKVFPAVVYIRCVRETLETGEKEMMTVSGSGVAINDAGLVLTNWHVIDKAIEVRCLLSDGRHFDAEIVGSDQSTDLALVQLDVEEGDSVPFAAFGDSAVLQEGDFVMAMGAPWGLNRSVSIGIVSCTRRFLPDWSEYSLWIQTDAAINPGNSGGPLVNTDGEIIGINTLGRGGSSDNIGFAIPSETIQVLLPQLREHGKVNWSWLGLKLQPLRDFNRDTYFEGEQGVLVADTDPQSPARRAGVKPLDRILAVNGEPIAGVTEEDLPALRRLFGLLAKDEEATLDVRRYDEELTLTILPTEKGDVEGEELELPRWDLSVKEINRFDNEDLYFHREEGVYVYGTKWPGNAQQAGLRQNDIIISIDGTDVVTLDDVRAVHERTLEDVDEKHRIVFVVLRNGLMRQIVLDFLRDYSKE
jgi:serine protease Do